MKLRYILVQVLVTQFFIYFILFHKVLRLSCLVYSLTKCALFLFIHSFMQKRPIIFYSILLLQLGDQQHLCPYDIHVYGLSLGYHRLAVSFLDIRYMVTVYNILLYALRTHTNNCLQLTPSFTRHLYTFSSHCTSLYQPLVIISTQT